MKTQKLEGVYEGREVVVGTAEVRQFEDRCEVWAVLADDGQKWLLETTDDPTIAIAIADEFNRDE